MKHQWWQKSVIYEIYPRSFMDSNGDGVGDLKGITDKLDYIQWLGVDTIWIGPFYPSPMADFGYDITDYKQVHPLFGNLKDLDNLIQEAHKRKIKVIIDFVPNHTSDQHPWFKESSASKNNGRHDWYLWHQGDGKGNPPNNWISVFGGSAWEWNDQRQEFYYHAFLKEQPDLNLRNLKVQEAIFDVMDFWLDRGIDGLRIDVMWHLYKDSLLRENPSNPDYRKDQPEYDKLLPFYSTDNPDVLEVICKMRKVIDKYPERMMMGEMYLSIHQTVSYYGPDNTGAHLPGNFTLLLLPWDARKIAIAIDECESSLPGGAWPNWVLGNHDRPRLATRIGKEQVRVAAILLLTLRGTPTMYYGDELGMSNVAIPREEMQDPQGKKMNLNRDSYRTPMLWNGDKNSGFTAGKPWLRVSEEYKKLNVEAQKADKASLLWLYKRLLELRKSNPVLETGDYLPLPSDQTILAYVRQHGTQRLMVILNLGDKPAMFTNTKFAFASEIVLDSNLKKIGKKVRFPIELEANEGIVCTV
jgi:alpha-glucosidase